MDYDDRRCDEHGRSIPGFHGMVGRNEDGPGSDRGRSVFWVGISVESEDGSGAVSRLRSVAEQV